MEALSTSRRSGRMHVGTWGHGSATWVLVHGWLVTGDVFAPLCRELRLDDAQLLVLDLAGTGRSRPAHSDIGLRSWTDDVVELLSERDGPVHLLGHSMGGLLAQIVAAEHPELVASLTLLLPVPITGFDLDQDNRALFETAGRDMLARRNILDASCSKLTAEQRTFMHRMTRTIDQLAVDNGLRAWLTGSPTTDVQRISCPTQVIASGDMILTDELLAQEVAGNIPGARFIQMPASGHYPQLAATAELARIIEDFAAQQF